MEKDELNHMERLVIYESLLNTINIYCKQEKISLESFCNWLLENTFPNKWICADHPETKIITELLRTIEYICEIKNISITEYESRIQKED